MCAVSCALKRQVHLLHLVYSSRKIRMIARFAARFSDVLNTLSCKETLVIAYLIHFSHDGCEVLSACIIFSSCGFRSCLVFLLYMVYDGLRTHV